MIVVESLRKHFREDMSNAQHKNAIVEQQGLQVTCLLHFDMLPFCLCSNLPGCAWKECAKHGLLADPPQMNEEKKSGVADLDK